MVHTGGDLRQFQICSFVPDIQDEYWTISIEDVASLCLWLQLAPIERMEIYVLVAAVGLCLLLKAGCETTNACGCVYMCV